MTIKSEMLNLLGTTNPEVTTCSVSYLSSHHCAARSPMADSPAYQQPNNPCMLARGHKTSIRHKKSNHFLNSLRNWSHNQKGNNIAINNSRWVLASNSEKVTAMPYPAEYKIPKFQKFDGRRGDSKEHIRPFLNSMGAFSYDNFLCLKEFSKSLTAKPTPDTPT